MSKERLTWKQAEGVCALLGAGYKGRIEAVNVGRKRTQCVQFVKNSLYRIEIEREFDENGVTIEGAIQRNLDNVRRSAGAAQIEARQDYQDVCPRCPFFEECDPSVDYPRTGIEISSSLLVQHTGVRPTVITHIDPGSPFMFEFGYGRDE